jgi:hypothetical protein
MPKKELIFFSTIIALGIIDWLTTISGLLFFNATELNPFLGELAKTSLVTFSTVKFSAVTLSGLTFYKAAIMTKSGDWHWAKNFLNGGYSFIAIAFLVVVASNLHTIITI